MKGTVDLLILVDKLKHDSTVPGVAKEKPATPASRRTSIASGFGDFEYGFVD